MYLIIIAKNIKYNFSNLLLFVSFCVVLSVTIPHDLAQPAAIISLTTEENNANNEIYVSHSYHDIASTNISLNHFSVDTIFPFLITNWSYYHSVYLHFKSKLTLVQFLTNHLQNIADPQSSII